MQFDSRNTTYTEFRFVAGQENELIVEKLLAHPELAHFFQSGDEKIFLSSERINDYRYINRYLSEVNRNMEKQDALVCFFETYNARKNRLKINKIPIVRNLFFFLDFIFNRIFPKIKGLNKIYFFFTKGKNRLLSKAEVLGRLVCSGFDIELIENHDGLCYLKARKNEFLELKKSSSYGLIFKMKRVGKNGKLFHVYKFRTMHPFSEYLHHYMLHKHGFARSGKIQDDFRLTPWGRWMRKYWIDELPQLYNLLKGDMKLVGVRPVSESYFELLDEDLKAKRIKFKPGCIPPYVSMNVNSSVNEVLEAEREYLERKEKNPYTTDLRFFFYALINILFKGKRSS